VSAGALGNFEADGYSLPYQYAVAAVALAYGIAALVLLFRVCRHFAEPTAAAAGAACTALGTTFVFFTALEPSWGHGMGATALLAFVAYWLRDFGGDSARRWFLLGLLLGLAAIMRWQLAAFGLVLLGEWAWTFRPSRPGVARLGRSGLLLAAGLFLGLVPQLVAWRVVYGAWLVEPMPLARNWLEPNLWRVLASPDRGFASWTPIVLLAAGGMAAAVVRAESSAKRVQAGLLLLAAAFQVYALAAISGSGVYVGASFGFRQLTETAVVLGPGLAALLAARRRWTPAVALACCALVGWNVLLMGAHRYGHLPDVSTLADFWRGASWYASMSLKRWNRPEAWSVAAVGLMLAQILAHRWRGPAAAPAAPTEAAAPPAVEPTRRAA
jgi:hypothetical protein